MSDKLSLVSMPKWGLEMSEGTINNWLVTEGAKITVDDDLVDIETSKIVNTLTAAKSGTLVKILASEGDLLDVGAALGVIATADASNAEIDAFIAANTAVSSAAVSVAEPTPAPVITSQPLAPSQAAAPATIAPAPAPAPVNGGADFAIPASLTARGDDDDIAATPVARRLATEHGIALGSMTGTGRHGRISVDDLRGAVIAAGGRFNLVRKASSASFPNGNKADDSQVPATPVARRLATELGINLLDCRRTGRHQRVSKADVEVAAHQHNTAMNGSATTASGVVEATPAPASPATSPQPLSAMRQIIAKRLQNSKREAPHFRACIEVEIDRLLALRKQLNNARNDANISVNDCLIKATAMALAAVPAVNIQFDGTQVTPMPHADIAVAVALEDGLITPIISRAETKGLVEISNEMRDLATRAKIGKLKPQEFQGGSFSISNLGMFGVSQFDAIINPPQAAILAVGVGERQLRPDGDSGVRQATVMTLTLSSDHRVIDGAIAAKFLQQLKSFIDQPATMLG